MKGISKVLGVVAGAALASHVMASEYQSEGKSSLAFSKNGRIEVSIFSVEATYYLDAVQVNEQPLAEAAFLDKASYVSASYNHYGMDADGSDYDLGGRYVLPENHIIAGGSVSFGDSDAFELFGGLYLDDYIEYPASVIVKYESNNDLDSKTLKGVGETLLEFKGNPVKLKASVGFLHDRIGSSMVVEAEGDYFLNRFTSVGATLNRGFGEYTGLDLEIRGGYFFTETLYVMAALNHLDENQGNRFGLLVEVGGRL